jgi:phthiocerol/phenolphthiocerol synthesis type-I polyketide synthase C
VPGGLDGIVRLLRPNAPVVAGELAPSVFWDIIRGMRPTWWARSANADFPVGALLTSQEWVDELETAGFASVAAAPLLGEARLGVIIHGVTADRRAYAEAPAPESPAFSWVGEHTTGADRLLTVLGQRLADPNGTEPPTATDTVWTIDAHVEEPDAAAQLSGRLALIAERCRDLGDASPRLWVLMDFGDADAGQCPLDRPAWCAITSAMRVVQNEYPGVQIRCLGLAGTAQPRVIDRAAEELLRPGDEREVFIAGDQRLVFRVERGATPAVPPPSIADDMAVRVASGQGANRGALAWVTDSRPEPGPGEVEIKVATTGLNFRDVMWNLRLLPEEALEDGYAGAGFGMECAGTVTRIGTDVEGFAAGDRVVAFVAGAFASHVVAPVFAVSPLPGNMTAEAATTVPVAFLTAYYSLVHLARLKRGETVLVHGGAGAVGLAAMQIARHVGANVIATAGSDEKRALLRNFGADLVCNSRTMAFADEVAMATDGKGVDVVLNSLAGEAMIRSMDCLAPFGRFVELGKRDFYANTHLGLRPLRKNLTYFGVDVDQLIGDHKELTRKLFGEIMQLFADGELVPLPYRVFRGNHIADAFRLMQRSGHIGKIVVTPATYPTDAGRQAGKFPVSAEGNHVVVGGTGGFGLATAEWLAGRGAVHLALVSRSAKLSEDSVAKVEALRRKGVEVDVAPVDVTDSEALERFLRKVAACRPIKGIVHAAMVLDDRLIEGLDREAIDAVLRPKVAGALNLERLTRDLELDYLLFYSSATTLFGNPGQFNYVAANAFIEGLARRLRSQGRPALAIAWGGIEDAGYLSRHIGANVNLKKRFASSLISAQMALDGLDWVHDQQGRQTTAAAAIARIDWAMAKRELAATRAPMFGAAGAAAGSRQAVDAAATLERLRAMSAEEATAALLDIVVDEIARVLRLPPKEVDRHRPLAEIGMDSLMMLELRTTVEAALQIELPIMSLASGITPADVARRVAPLITGEAPKQAVPGTLVALSASHFGAEAETTDVTDQRAAVDAVLERVRALEGPL